MWYNTAIDDDDDDEDDGDGVNDDEYNIIVFIVCTMVDGNYW